MQIFGQVINVIDSGYATKYKITMNCTLAKLAQHYISNDNNMQIPLPTYQTVLSIVSATGNGNQLHIITLTMLIYK